ncbi:hypothetical protein [Thioclava sp. GXIMD4216]|uniref:Uncharacterized protein n=1 Tax=Thioclava litoralis TaxID=3076557 RepID=A0ABZ1DYD4_9RHOB|nr:hypothetical protein RPE78_07670 [Thioclava sp. FTW29]
MKRILALTSVMALSAGAALAASGPVTSVTVNNEIHDQNGPAAQAFYTKMAADLQTQIIADLGPAFDPDKAGSSIKVDLDEAEVASTWDTLANIADSKLGAQINVYSATDNGKFDHYDLDVGFPNIAVSLPEGTDATALTVDDPLYYNALIDLFSQEVVKRLK